MGSGFSLYMKLSRKAEKKAPLSGAQDNNQPLNCYKSTLHMPLLKVCLIPQNPTGYMSPKDRVIALKVLTPKLGPI